MLSALCRLPPGTDPATIDYGVAAARAQPFYAAIRAYLPRLPDAALQPSYSGVRPKVRLRRCRCQQGCARQPAWQRAFWKPRSCSLHPHPPPWHALALHTAAPLVQVAGPGQPAGDFVVQGPHDHGVPGLLNLFGIESPGLTASLAIARRVAAALLGGDGARRLAGA